MEQDRVSGAAEIERKVIEHLLKQDDVFSASLEILEMYPSMGSIWNAVNNLFLYGMDARRRAETDSIKKVVKDASGIIEDVMTIATYSRSSTVVEILKNCAGKNIKVMCSESRPLMEGRKLAEEIKNLQITFTTDAALLSLIEEADAILLGADAITEGGVVNKVGSSTLALMAAQKGIPLWIAATLSKVFPHVFIKEESGKEIWEKPPSNVRVKNFYFDFTPSSLITLFITEEGISTKKPEFRGKISEEVGKIEKILEKKYYRVR